MLRKEITDPAQCGQLSLFPAWINADFSLLNFLCKRFTRCAPLEILLEMQLSPVIGVLGQDYLHEVKVVEFNAHVQQIVAISGLVDESQKLFAVATIAEHVLDNLQILRTRWPREDKVRPTALHDIFFKSLLLLPALLDDQVGHQTLELALVEVNLAILNQSPHQKRVYLRESAFAKLAQTVGQVLLHRRVLFIQKLGEQANIFRGGRSERLYSLRCFFKQGHRSLCLLLGEPS